MTIGTLDVIDPATEDIITSVADATAEDARAAVARAAARFPSWADTSPRRRSEILNEARDRLLARADEVAETIVLENGKPIAEARGEVAYAAEFLRWFAEEAVRMDGGIVEAPGGGGKIMTLLQPVGVSLLVT